MALWSIGGTILILAATWYQVQLDVRINEWFGEFYDTLQKALLSLVATEKNLLLIFLLLQKLQLFILVVILSDYFPVIGLLDGEQLWLIFIMISAIFASSIEGVRAQEDNCTC